MSDTRCHQEDLPKTMTDEDRLREESVLSTQPDGDKVDDIKMKQTLLLRNLK